MKVRDEQILRLALPSIISNITVPLLGLVDVAIIGHIGDAHYIAAISVGTMVFNVLYWVFGFLRMGTGGMTSQAIGRRDLAEVVRLILRAFVVGFGLGMVFVLFQRPLISLGIWIMQPSPDIVSLCRRYCLICIWGAPAVLSLYGFTGWYVGMQNTRLPMVISIAQNLVNIIVSLFLVFGLHWDIEGVAYGTAIAQWTGFLMALLFWWISYRRLWKYLRFSSSGRKEKKSAWLKFFVVNRDLFIRTLFLVSVFLCFTAIGSRQGALILAANTLLMEFFTIFSYFTDGFAYAGEALGGKAYGARNGGAFREVTQRLFVLGAFVTLAFTVFYLTGGMLFLQLLTNDPTVIQTVRIYFPWAVAIPLSGVAAFLLDGIFVGIMHTKGLLSSSVIAALCFFGSYYFLRTGLGNHALWLAFIVYLAVRGIVEAILFRPVLRASGQW